MKSGKKMKMFKQDSNNILNNYMDLSAKLEVKIKEQQPLTVSGPAEGFKIWEGVKRHLLLDLCLRSKFMIGDDMMV